MHLSESGKTVTFVPAAGGAAVLQCSHVEILEGRRPRRPQVQMHLSESGKTVTYVPAAGGAAGPPMSDRGVTTR